MTFAALFVSEKREKRKSYFMFLAGERCSPLLSSGSSRELSNAERCLASPRQGNADPYEIKPEYSQQTKEKIYSLSRQRTN